MIILAHRGFWIDSAEKNSLSAFNRAFESGFGIETDIRDSKQQLFIAHDMATGDEMRADSFFDCYNDHLQRQTLALNVKADGLQQALGTMLRNKGIDNYFFFDMSIPDALGYVKNGLTMFTRQSEYELQPCLYDAAAGVWMDEFKGHWIEEDVILGHIRNGKKICLVSPELHKRNYREEWDHYRHIMNKFGLEDLMLCTDHPLEAQNFFNV